MTMNGIIVLVVVMAILGWILFTFPFITFVICIPRLHDFVFIYLCFFW